ncbi:hypothetical protein MTO96_035465, partial [Rhipicephalus appendiculatus]
IAAALAVRKVCTRILEVYREHSIFSMVLSDRLAVDACNRFAVYSKRATEMRRQKKLDPSRPLVVIVCGGSAASRQQLEEWTKKVSSTGAASPLDHSGID